MNNNIKVPANHTAYHVITTSHLSRLPTYVLFVVLGFIVFSSTLQAQDRTTTDKATYRRYDTQKYVNERLSRTGSGTAILNGERVFTVIRDTENLIKEKEGDVKVEPTVIQLVFHMMNVKDEKEIQNHIVKQIEALNRDFNNRSFADKHPNDPKGLYLKRAASAQITFQLGEEAQVSKYGKGIATLRDSDKSWSTWDEMKDVEYEGSPGIESSKYLNIWVCDLPQGRGSYATSIYDISEADGIVIDAAYFGVKEDKESAYGQGKTLTHLMGNYLGLHDLWNESEPCADDYVSDTPIHNMPNRGMPRYKHVTTCETRRLVQEMTMNFMDSTDDEYQMMFTEGQVRRMHAALHALRPGMIFTPTKDRTDEN